MTILLFVLRLIGWILLILLLILLVAIVTILFVPIKYRIQATYLTKLDAQVKICWLCKILQFHIQYRDDDLQIFYRILGLKRNLVTETEVEEECTQETKEEQISQEIKNSLQSENVQHFIDVSEEDNLKITKEKKNPFGIISRIKSIFLKVWGMIKNINATISKIKMLISDQRNQEAFNHLKEEIFCLLKIVIPKKLKLNALFSTGSPDTTGQVLGILAMFPIGYQNRWNITPDFSAEEFLLEADTDIKGHIFLFRVLGIGLRIVMDKNCRRLYKQLMK